MEVVQGKATDKKIVIAQEIAFAKVLAGNNKTLRDQALKKLKKWLTVRGNGKWAFSEEEFIRIWTGLFYCMWMSDKFLVQEELAENISHLIHCFKKSSSTALTFIKCFHKRILMEYEGLDQYRVDKFHMLIRRFLRQSFEYCKNLDWDESVLKELMNIYNEVVFNQHSPLGFILHFINIYPEELAKVSKGKITNKQLVMLIEPIVRLLAKSKDERPQKAAFEFFIHLMRQTDVGIEFEERFQAWRQMGFPGKSLDSIKRQEVSNGHHGGESSEEEGEDDDDDDDSVGDEPLDPRAGSVHVNLPQIPVDVDGVVELLRRYERGKLTTGKGKRKLRSLIQRLSALKKGKFPVRAKKDPIIDEKVKKSRTTINNAKSLMQFTDELDDGPVRSKELKNAAKSFEESDEDEVDDDDDEEDEEDGDDVSDEEMEDEGEEDLDDEVDDEEEEGEEDLDDEDEELELDDEDLDDVEDEDEFSDLDDIETDEEEEEEEEEEKKTRKETVKNNKNKLNSKNKTKVDTDNKQEICNGSTSKRKRKNRKKKKKIEGENQVQVQGTTQKELKAATSPNTRPVDKGQANKSVGESPAVVKGDAGGEPSPSPKKRPNRTPNGTAATVNGSPKANGQKEASVTTPKSTTPSRKRKVLGDWQVQELDEGTPEYHRLKPQKIIKLEVKTERAADLSSEENQEPDEGTPTAKDKPKQVFTPAFWERAKAKALNKRDSKEGKVFKNPFAGGVAGGPGGDTGSRRISFALDKNMAQENDEYLEEVRNSPNVPFDRSKKPVQSALKSGLSPSPINPFYRFKKIKF